uniref:Uncharacterized protein n=1 Tax=Anguilla anguilla TaxID=7936 RepID=A0A0E9Q962_ANGAN
MVMLLLHPFRGIGGLEERCPLLNRCNALAANKNCMQACNFHIKLNGFDCLVCYG